MRSFLNLIALSVIAGSHAAPLESASSDLVGREPDFILPNLSKRQDYNQDYTTGGSVNFSPTSNGYSVTFSNAQDFVVGKGWTTGSTRAISFSGSFSATAGTVELSVYGWTTNPLVEYYIMEDYTSYQGGGTHKGTVSSDGSTYDIYENTRTNEPSIQGTSTFNQYISVRQSKRSSGTVTTSNHFNAWKSLGLNLGSYSYQVIATEGWGGASGSSTMTVSEGTGSSSPPPSTGGGGGTSTGGGGGSGSAAHWGQCGGQGWTGPTSCASPYTCQAANQWYSQCL